MNQYLTSSRKRILRLLDKGLSSKEMAAETHTSVRTVETLRYKMNKDFGVHHTEEVLQIAKKRKLL